MSMSDPWLAIRRELPPRRRSILSALAFALPLGLWCLMSYCPLVWHPLVEIHDPGDPSVAGDHAYLAAGQRVDRAVFEARNRTLSAAGKPLATGTPANPIYLPAPHRVARAMYTAFTTPPQRNGDKWLHASLWHSCRIVFLGFLYSALLGIPLGILCGTFGLFSRLVEPFVDFIRYMPAPVFGALAVAVLGLADAPKVAIIFIGTFFQMVLVLANTTRQLDLSLIEAGQTLGANRRQLLLRVVVPGVLPELVRDLRILIGWAWTYLVVAELIGEKSGISAFIYQQQRYRNFDNVYAAIIVIGLIGLVTDQLLVRAERAAFPYVYGPTRLGRWVAAVGARLRAPVPAWTPGASAEREV